MNGVTLSSSHCVIHLHQLSTITSQYVHITSLCLNQDRPMNSPHKCKLTFQYVPGSQPGFENCPSNPAIIPKQPVQPDLGISIHTLFTPRRSRTRCSAKKRNTVQWKCPWSAIIAATAYKVTRIHTFQKQYKDFY